MLKLLPDWTPARKVVLALPGAKSVPDDRERIVLAYAKYLRDFEIPVLGLVSKRTSTEYRTTLESIGVELLEISAGDIWIRDWAPLLCSRDGRLVAVKFKYPDTYSYAAGMDNKAGIQLVEKLELELIESNLIWELGNYTTNGKDVVVTNQVLAANKLGSVQEFQQRLIQELDFDPGLQFHCFEANTWDMLIWDLFRKPWRHSICHIDGYLRFIDDSTIVSTISELTELEQAAWQNWKKPSPTQKKIFKYWAYTQQIQTQLNTLMSKLGEKYNIIHLDHESKIPSGDDFLAQGETIPDTGDYINYLRFGSRLFLPHYFEEVNDKHAQELYKRFIADTTSVREQFVSDLAQAGGVLNCASWVLYDDLSIQ